MRLGHNSRVLLLACLAFGSATVVAAGSWRLPGDNQGYRPPQPIAFSHRLHAGELGMDCLYCHYGAAVSRNAGIPPSGLCMNCHRIVTAGFDALQEERQLAQAQGREPDPVVSPPLQALYDSLGLDGRMQPVPGAEPRPVEWVRVHSLPDFAYFDHRPHVTRGIACETCHGPVSSMERIRQESSLAMGWCVACHREYASEAGQPAPSAVSLRERNHVSTDCSTCHF